MNVYPRSMVGLHNVWVSASSLQRWQQHAC